MQPRRVLHVDDDPALTALVAAYLQHHGYQTLSCHDPRKALQELQRHHVRVVLLDIDMPDVNGMELLEQIKAYDGGIQVVMLTGLVSMQTALQSLHRGAEACCFKPITDLHPLLNAVQACFEKLQRWWDMLDDLTRRTREAQQQLADAEAQYA